MHSELTQTLTSEHSETEYRGRFWILKLARGGGGKGLSGSAGLQRRPRRDELREVVAAEVVVGPRERTAEQRLGVDFSAVPSDASVLSSDSDST